MKPELIRILFVTTLEDKGRRTDVSVKKRRRKRNKKESETVRRPDNLLSQYEPQNKYVL